MNEPELIKYVESSMYEVPGSILYELRDLRAERSAQAERLAAMERMVREAQTLAGRLLSYDLPDEVAACLRVLEDHCAATLGEE